MWTIYFCQQKNSIYQILILLLKQNAIAVLIKSMRAPSNLHIHAYDTNEELEAIL